jgi:hypothetical protein
MSSAPYLSAPNQNIPNLKQKARCPQKFVVIKKRVVILSEAKDLSPIPSQIESAH